MNVQLSEHFWSSEFKCGCNRWNCDAKQLPEPQLVNLLEDLRQRIMRPIILTSGIRCVYWNELKGGVKESAHIKAKAADIAAATSGEKYELLANLYRETILFNRLGIGATFIHVDVSMSLAQHVCWTY